MFAADSAAAAAQLASAGPAEPGALTAASLADLAAALLGGPRAGRQWLRDHPVPADREPLARDARLQPLALTGPADAVAATVRQTWRGRVSAARAYARLLSENGRDPASVADDGTETSRNQPDHALQVVLQSPVQIVMMVAPILVLLSPLVGASFTLVLPPLLLVALLVAVMVAVVAVQDGDSTWLEGGAMLALYAIVATALRRG